jgi:protease-4
MLKRAALVLLAAVLATPASSVMAEAPATKPSHAGHSPSTQPAKAAEPSTRPVARVDAPATRPAKPATAPAQADANKFPTPAELAAKMQQRAAEKKAMSKVAFFDFDSALSEKPADFSLFGVEGTTLRSLLDRLALARDDKDIRAVLIRFGNGAGFSFAQAQELRDMMGQLRKAGKKTFVYADTYDTLTYLVASSATNVCMMEGGEIMVQGIGIETMYYRGAFDKFGVKADFVQIGEYKGAEEPYVRTGPSDESRGELDRLVDGLYTQVVDMMSKSRGLSPQVARTLIDETMISGKAAKERGLIDHTVDVDGLKSLLADELGNKVDLIADYGEKERPELDFSNPIVLLSQVMRKEPPSNKPTVAIVYAEGTIVDGDGGSGGLLGGGSEVGGEYIRRAMREIARDNNIKAVVIRIDSPGGSAMASEVMWQAVRRVAKDKPVVISIGGMAASGGYYLASAGDTIWADPAAIVGSIGVVGGKFVLKDLYNWVGLSTEEFSRGRNAGMWSSNKAWDERQRRLVRDWMRNTYDQFTERVMTTRAGKIADIDRVARGRIFLAADAKALGMVDELGGLQMAIKDAAKRGELNDGEYEVRQVPAPQTLGDLLSGGDQRGKLEAAAKLVRPQITISADSVLHLMPKDAKRLIGRQIQLGQLLQDRPCVLVSPYVITVK